MLALRVPAAFEIRELASDAADALAHEPPVDFELGFSLAEARSDATAHAMCCQMAPHATQARVEVLVLGELDLQTALATRCMQGKNVEDERRAVDDLYGLADDALEIALLRRRELVIEYDDVGMQVMHAPGELLGLAGADEGTWIGRVEPLGHRVDDLGTRRIGEALELGHRFA